MPIKKLIPIKKNITTKKTPHKRKGCSEKKKTRKKESSYFGGNPTIDQLVPGLVVRLTIIKAKTRPGIEASSELD